MTINVPLHFTGPEARLVSQLLEVLIDALIDFHTAFFHEYRWWLELPDPPDFPGCDDDAST
jgi:hypothetical protein